MQDTLSEQYLNRWKSLKAERESYVTHWREISDYVQPRRGLFLEAPSTRRNSAGRKRNENIINSTPTFSSRVLRAGMSAGVTPSARPWFGLTTPDPDLAEFGSVRSWLHIVEERIRHALKLSNLYNCLQHTYGDLGDFGTAGLHIDEDVETLLRGYVYPIGSYCIANDDRLAVDTVYRETGMTVRQLVKKFGLERCSNSVKDAYRNKRFDEYFDVVHAIQPNEGYEQGKLGPVGMRFKSCWLESNATGVDQRTLHEGGYEELPGMFPRWEVNGEDVYGSSPGMVALGDAKALQLLEKRKLQGVDKIISPPMRGPSSLQHQKASILPGVVTYVDAVHQGQTFAPAMEIPPAAVQIVGLEIKEHEQRIKQAYFADLWLLLSTHEGQMTATEVAQRQEEKLLQLGPVMERLEDELLDPMIERVFGILLRRGYLPPPPEELQGMELKVEYTSIMAQAQKLVGTTSIERLTQFTVNLATAAGPSVLDKLNLDEVVDEYGAALSIKPDLIRSDEEVAQMRAERAQAQQQAAAAEQAAAVTQSAKTLSETDTQGQNGLTDLLNATLGQAGSTALVN